MSFKHVNEKRRRPRGVAKRYRRKRRAFLEVAAQHEEVARG